MTTADNFPAIPSCPFASRELMKAYIESFTICLPSAFDEAQQREICCIQTITTVSWFNYRMVSHAANSNPEIALRYRSLYFGICRKCQTSPLIQTWDARHFITFVDFSKAVADDLFGLAIENGHVEEFARWLRQSRDGSSTRDSVMISGAVNERCGLAMEVPAGLPNVTADVGQESVSLRKFAHAVNVL